VSLLTSTDLAEELLRSGLREVESAMPVLADILRCDVVLYTPTYAGAIALAESRPATVPSICAERQVGRLVSRTEEPAVIRVLGSGKPARRLSRGLVHGAPTVQDVFPVMRDGACVAAVVFEVGLIEHERQRRKSPVFKNTVELLRWAALAGRVAGARELSRLGDHDGPLVIDS